jgi:hypothetical protein
LIGDPVGWAAALPDGLVEAGLAAVDALPVEVLLEELLLLDEHAPTARTVARAPTTHKSFFLGII